MIEVIRYSAKYKTDWDAFVRNSRNGTFLFYRDYMDYHAHRFTDHSLLFYQGGKLVALLPANETGTEITSHGGLTYGGMLSDWRMKTEGMLAMFVALRLYFKARGFQVLRYKAIPHIYHQAPAEEDLYALFRNGAQLYRRDVSAVIELANSLGSSSLRKRKLKQAPLLHLAHAQEAQSYRQFMQLMQELLATKYNVAPVHSPEEMIRLARQFPANIKLYTATVGAEMLAGILLYETATVAHCQYIGTTARGREVAALDVLVNWLLTEVYAQHRYFDFGISTEQQGQYLNSGLIRNKESYGARAVVYDFYEMLF
ncbi:GNAT family N-acetyltransferase [Pontibacter liquoris]|uniref:GNAT family N-acetyltransferase n=1 Tax=Pontibacter liquoris TaxID=2905677 RepID=UPI001FA70A9F|nr:GNAT family N-acetyltransferase [Pontibacter liquoris]